MKATIKMRKVIICVGIPASGKTTWSKQYCSENKNVIRVNRDDIRSMMCQVYSRELEDIVRDTERGMITAALNNDFDVVVDDTNLSASAIGMINQAINATNKRDVFVQTMLFNDVSLEECIERDSNRDKQVGESVIRCMYEKINK